MADSSTISAEKSVARSGAMSGRARTRDEIVAEICQQVSDGGVLNDVLGPDRPEGYPSRWGFYQWKAENAEYEKQYEEAVKLRIDRYVEETAAIADDGTNDWVLRNDPTNPGYNLNGEHVQRSKIRISTRQWLAEKMWPRKYGQKVAVGGSDDMPPIKSSVAIGNPEDVYRALLGGGTLAGNGDEESFT
jgi:hypothetical protein